MYIFKRNNTFWLKFFVCISNKDKSQIAEELNEVFNLKTKRREE